MAHANPSMVAPGMVFSPQLQYGQLEYEQQQQQWQLSVQQGMLPDVTLCHATKTD